jgi:hypothetical protein
MIIKRMENKEDLLFSINTGWGFPPSRCNSTTKVQRLSGFLIPTFIRKIFIPLCFQTEKDEMLQVVLQARISA